MSQTQITQTTSATTEKTSSKKKRGRPTGWRKTKPAEVEETGNPDFNLNDAEPLEESAFAPVADAPRLEVDIEALERQRFAKPVHKKAQGAITAEDLAIDLQLEAMLKENVLPEISDDAPVKLITQERKTDCLLSDLVAETTIATTLNELDHQCALAKQLGADAIEADEKVIRYFTRSSFEAVKTAGYFMYKDVKVFFPERYKETIKTDKANMFWALHGESKK